LTSLGDSPAGASDSESELQVGALDAGALRLPTKLKLSPSVEALTLSLPC
jgi:hypothetical protein